jgi:hypothetical protein
MESGLMARLISTLAIALLAGSARPPITPPSDAVAAQAGPEQCKPAEPWPVIPSSAPAHSTYEAAREQVPQRFRGPVDRVRLDFKSAAEVNRYCAGGVVLCDRVFYACASGRRITMPNPCDYPAGDEYAALLCHELGHLNGWPATHGD